MWDLLATILFKLVSLVSLENSHNELARMQKNRSDKSYRFISATFLFKLVNSSLTASFLNQLGTETKLQSFNLKDISKDLGILRKGVFRYLLSLDHNDKNVIKLESYEEAILTRVTR